MVRKVQVLTDRVPTPEAFYSQGVLYTRDSDSYILKMSGQIGIRPGKSCINEFGVVAETRRTMNNLEAVLNEVGWTFANVVETFMMVRDIQYYHLLDLEYTKFFKGLTPPTRTLHQVYGLPHGAEVEIKMNAIGGSVNQKYLTKLNNSEEF